MAAMTTEGDEMPRAKRDDVGEAERMQRVMDQKSGTTSAAMVPSPIDWTARVGEAQSEADLDAAVERINAKELEFALSGFDLGRELARVIDANLWKLRERPDGEPAYRSWTAWLRAETRIGLVHRSRALTLMAVARKFSREQAEEYGTTILGHVVGVPEEEQAPLLHKAKSEKLTTREVGTAAKALREARRTPEQRAKDAQRAETSRKKIDGIQKQLALDASTKPKKPPVQLTPQTKDEITLAVVLGKKHRIPLFRAEKDKAGNLKPATKAGSAHGWLDLPNGVRLVLQVVEQAGRQPEIILTARRET